jgi:AcrR family transcriptional regulator
VAAPQRKRPGRPSAAASAETRERILRAACQRFALSGYDRARNQEIAADAGVTSAALYHYFDSKAALFAEAWRRGLELVLEAYRAADARGGGAVDRLCRMIEANVALNREHPGLADFLAIAPLEARRRPELGARVVGLGAEVPALFAGVLREGVAGGELRADLAVESAVHLIVAASYGLSWFRGLLPSREAHDAALRAFQALLRGSLLREPEAPQVSRPPGESRRY